AAAEIHVNTAWQAWIEAAHSAHDVDALKFVRTIVFKDRRVLHGVLVRSWCSINIARISVPRSGRIRMIICDLAAANDQVMRKNTADSFVKSATDGFVRNFERCERGRASSVHLRDCLLKEIISAGRGIRLKIRASTVALDRVAPFRNAPGKFDFRFGSGLRQTN